MFRRAKASGIKPVRLLNHVLQFYFTFMQEKVHPLQGGFFRRKIRRSAAPACRAKTRSSSIRAGSGKSSRPTSSWSPIYLFLHRIRKKVERDATPYYDPALVMPEPEPAETAAKRQPETAAAA